MGPHRLSRKSQEQGVVSVMANDPLDTRALHDQIHNLVLSRRQGFGVWKGHFETAWAGYVLTKHSPENRQEEVLNSIKGEILGENRLTAVKDPYGLASAYMIAVFLHQVGADRNGDEFMAMAQEFSLAYLNGVDWEEKFHFFSTADYVFAASLALEAIPQADSRTLAALKQACAIFQQDQWGHNTYVLALAGSAQLRITGFQAEHCLEIARFVSAYQELAEEDKIALLWFLDTHWEQMRQKLTDDAQLVANIDRRRIELRTRVFRFYTNYVTEPDDTQQSLSAPSVQKLERVGGERVVSTIELLMLDEVAERHSVSAMVVTREEWERRDTIVTVFDSYRHQVDQALERLELANELALIYRNLTDDNPAAWRQAALTCRHIIYELSRKLLQVPDEKYPYVLGKDNQPMSLVSSKEKNRLQAYMHQVGIRSKNPLVVRQLDYMTDLMRVLIDETSGTGKAPIPSYQEARSIVLQTYLFLGELERLTGFQIVTHITAPS
jgi:hypothetical protein